MHKSKCGRNMARMRIRLLLSIRFQFSFLKNNTQLISCYSVSNWVLSHHFTLCIIYHYICHVDVLQNINNAVITHNDLYKFQMVSLKQEFEFYDYFGPVAVALLFAVIVLLISFFVLNFFFISKYDEPTVFERVRVLFGGINLSHTYPAHSYLALFQWTSGI